MDSLIRLLEGGRHAHFDGLVVFGRPVSRNVIDIAVVRTIDIQIVCRKQDRVFPGFPHGRHHFRGGGYRFVRHLRIMVLAGQNEQAESQHHEHGNGIQQEQDADNPRDQQLPGGFVRVHMEGQSAQG